MTKTTKAVVVSPTSSKVVEMRLVDIGGVMVLVLDGISVRELETNQAVFDEIKRMARIMVTRALEINFMSGSHTEGENT